MKPRYRRNPFELTAPEAAPQREAPRGWSLAGLTVIGLVVNPKTKEPALVVTDGTHVSLRSAFSDDPLRRMARGYFETDDTMPSRVTELPRSHTPEGVIQAYRGQGWGTALYTGLVVAASQTDDNIVDIKMSTNGQGICSETDSRSHEADSWWRRAVKLDLAEQNEGEEQEEVEEYVDVDVEPDDLNDIVEIDEGTITYVNKVSVDITKTTPGASVESYLWKSATSHSLVLAALHVELPQDLPHNPADALDALWRAVLDDPDLIDYGDDDALLAVDIRGMDIGIVNLISLCMMGTMTQGAAEEAVGNLRFRHEHQLDPGAESPQRRLSFAANQAGMADVVAARNRVDWDSLAELP